MNSKDIEYLDVVEMVSGIPESAMDELTINKGYDIETRDDIVSSPINVEFSNSSLVEYVKISPNKTKNRNHIIDTVSIHCVAGNCTIETIGNIFANSNAGASSNYGIDSNGRIGLYVDERDRSWCTSSPSNDNRAITIEVSNDTGGPEWHVTDKAMNALIELLVDICKRNNILKLLWKDDKNLIGNVNEQNMTVHRWFSAKACPGDYLYNNHGYIADEVNKKLNNIDNVVDDNTLDDEDKSDNEYTVKVTASALNYRKGPGLEYSICGQIHKNEIYTIVDEHVSNNMTWGKLKSGAGWISLNYVTRL